MHAAHYTDQFIRQRWEYLPSDPQYRGKTTLLLTTDHGRGGNLLGQWAHHSHLLRGSDHTWLAMPGPDTPPTGEQRAAGQLYQHQLAQTIARLLNVPHAAAKPTGAPIKAIFARPQLAAEVAGPLPAAASFAPLTQSLR